MPVNLERDHGGAGVEPPGSLVGAALHHHALRVQERRDGPGCRARVDARQNHAPLRHLKPQTAFSAWPASQFQNLDHVNPVRQGHVEPVPHVRCGTHAGQRDLQVLSLARGARRRSPRVRDLRMRRESRGVRDGQAGLPYSPLDRTRDVPVARETHPAAFRIPDHQALDHGRGRRGGRYRTCHRARPAFEIFLTLPVPPVSPPPTTISGRSFAPVGPA